MAGVVNETGRLVVVGTAGEQTGFMTPASINASTAITFPAKPSASNAISGQLECLVSIEGTNTFRVRFDGVAPTAGVGILYPAPTATVPVQLLLHGRDVIAGFRVIGTAAGNTITWQFFSPEMAQ